MNAQSRLMFFGVNVSPNVWFVEIAVGIAGGEPDCRGEPSLNVALTPTRARSRSRFLAVTLFPSDVGWL
jgi:hypothetical protein